MNSIYSPPRTKHLKRLRQPSSIITDSRAARRDSRIIIGAVSIPKNNPRAYRAELRRRQFYPFAPSDKTTLSYLTRRGRLDKLVYGFGWFESIEKLILDAETNVPWQVPKITSEFKRIDYVGEEQEYTAQARLDEGVPVSPTRIPNVQQMSRDEYEDAVERFDDRVAIEGRHLFEFCRDTDIEWLRYEDR